MATHEIPSLTVLTHKIGAVSFSDYSKVKSLYLPSDARDASPKSFFDNATGAVYIVPAGKVFIAGLVSYYLDYKYCAGRIGEGTTLNGQISREQMCFGTGTTFPDQTEQIGVFRNVADGGGYVNGESSSGHKLRVPTFLYGIEMLKTPAMTVQFDVGGYLLTDYNDLRVLYLPGTATNNSRKTFHDVRTKANYQVPAGKVFVAGMIAYWIDYASTVGKIGWASSLDSRPTRDIFACGLGTVTVRIQHIFGIFPSEKYINAHASSGFGIRTPCHLFGAEIDA